MQRNPPRKTAFRVLITMLLSLIALAIILGGASVAGLVYLDSPPAGIPVGGTLFTVNAGESGAGIARRLEEEGLIRSSLAFQGFLRLGRVQTELKRGTYRIEPGMRSRDILDLLVSGKQALIRVTIPEGYTMRQTAEALEAALVVEKNSFLAAAKAPGLLKELGIPAPNAEGYLYPDTYFLSPGTSGAEIVRLMVTALRTRLAEKLPESLDLSPQELHDRIILASIVEREYRRPEEAPRIAGVFWNRLRIGMGLQSCATVVYIITEIQGKKHPETLYTQDIEIRNPYNTYIYRGLPPGPIANPGMTALEATFRPENSRYLYFRLLDPETGRHYFAESLDEHIKAGSLAVKRVGGR